MAVQGCLRLPKAALTSRGLHEGCPRLSKAALISIELKNILKVVANEKILLNHAG